jgi:hypothetical protein
VKQKLWGQAKVLSNLLRASGELPNRREGIPHSKKLKSAVIHSRE